MDRISATRSYVSLVSIASCLFLGGASLFAAQDQTTPESRGPNLTVASRRGVSAPQRDFKVAGPFAPGPSRVIKNKLNLPKQTSSAGATDARVQAQPGGVAAPGILGQFEGGSDDDNATVLGFRIVPPDTDGDVGPDHYVQFINSIWIVFDKAGTILQGPLPGNSPYAGFGGVCESTNDGDPIVKYDRMADRWVLTQFAVPNYPDGPSYQCFAVSQTGDPMGAYNLYEFTIGSFADGWGDYPKMGIWPDGYYVAYNMFTASAFEGMGCFAFDRTNMLAGAPATAVSFVVPTDGGGLSSDMDGLIPPPAGTPNYYLTWWDPAVGTLNIYEFHVDFATPANSTFTGPTEFGNAPFVFPPCPAGVTCVPQLGGETLDTLGDRLMYRLAYRNWGTHESLVTSQTVDSGGRTGVRWYEVRDPGGTPTMFQGATFSPDTTYRWMPSIAQDASQNMALGYSKSDAASFPSIAITGRLVGDPVNTMGAEDVWLAGTGSQISSFNRWGDYSAMDLDPVDECTFWFTSEYYANTNSFDFKTRVGSFKFPSCVSPASGALEGDVTDGTNPIAGVLVTAGVSSRMTDAAGHYSFATLPVASYDMTATKAGYAPGSALGVVVTDGGTTVQDFILVPTVGTLQGTVTDGTNPIEDATVTANGTSTQTDAAGFYSMTLDDGTYDVTASKPGYESDTALGVVVTAGGTTIQDFVLVPAVNEILNGVVSDGSGQGWRLYARLDISGTGFDATLFTDPVTGYYSISLPAGATYNVTVTSVIPGYNVGHFEVFVPVPAAVGQGPNAFVQNFDLTVDGGLCIAPGYTPGDPVPGVFTESFDGGVLPPGWTVNNYSGNGVGWQIQTDFAPCFEVPGNPTGGTGAFALVNSDCDGFVDVDADIQTSSIDLSAFDGATLTFKQLYDNLGDIADVDVSIDGGATWTNVLRQTADNANPATAVLTGAGGQSDVKVRWHYYNAFFAWWWAVDDIVIDGATCNPSPGGLVVGTVSDGNTGDGLVGATVKNMPDGDETETVATPDDPNVGEGFYGVFAGSGPQPFEASANKYQSQTQNINVIPNATVRLDFSLAAGWLTVDPTEMSSKVLPGLTEDQELTLTNIGNAAASFEIVEINAPLAVTAARGPFATPRSNEEMKQAAQGPGGIKNFNKHDTRGFPAGPAPQLARRLNATGDILASWNSGLPLAWGVTFEPSSEEVWLSNNTYIGSSDDALHSYQTDGTAVDVLPIGGAGGLWMGDLTTNTQTGMLWGVNIGGDNCLAEMDPSSLALTGNKICGSPWTGISQRGVAYDGATDTYYVGGWNEGIVYHIDGTGAVLDSAQLNFGNCFPSPACISGLAYNSESGHLLVMQNEGGQDPIVVVDAANGYATLGTIAISGFSDFGGGGMDFNCDGNLWLIDQDNQTVYLIESGEPASCGSDIPWLSENPTEGVVPAGGAGGGGTNPFPVTVTFDSAGLFPGLRQAQLRVTTDTPYPVDPVGVNFTVRFLDVPLDEPPGTNPFENYIYGAAGANIMHGCSFFNFCPNNAVTRADMAGYIWRGIHGAFASPPAYTGIFLDVFFGDYNSDYIQGIWDDGITAGCNADPLLFCPNFFINRGQMAVFIEKGLRGPDFVPPPCTGIFADVPCPPTPQDPFADWIEQLYNDGITAGCNTNPLLFCPNIPIPNEQMAVFIVKVFELPVLP